MLNTNKSPRTVPVSRVEETGVELVETPVDVSQSDIDIALIQAIAGFQEGGRVIREHQYAEFKAAVERLEAQSLLTGELKQTIAAIEEKRLAQQEERLAKVAAAAKATADGPREEDEATESQDDKSSVAEDVEDETLEMEEKPDAKRVVLEFRAEFGGLCKKAKDSESVKISKVYNNPANHAVHYALAQIFEENSESLIGRKPIVWEDGQSVKNRKSGEGVRPTGKERREAYKKLAQELGIEFKSEQKIDAHGNKQKIYDTAGFRKAVFDKLISGKSDEPSASAAGPTTKAVLQKSPDKLAGARREVIKDDNDSVTVEDHHGHEPSSPLVVSPVVRTAPLASTQSADAPQVAAVGPTVITKPQGKTA